MAASASGDVVDSAAHGMPPFAEESKVGAAVGKNVVAVASVDRAGGLDPSPAEGEDARTGESPNAARAERARAEPERDGTRPTGDSEPIGPLPTRF
jgi:hypothetical protein